MRWNYKSLSAIIAIFVLGLVIVLFGRESVERRKQKNFQLSHVAIKKIGYALLEYTEQHKTMPKSIQEIADNVSIDYYDIQGNKKPYLYFTGWEPGMPCNFPLVAEPSFHTYGTATYVGILHSDYKIRYYQADYFEYVVQYTRALQKLLKEDDTEELLRSLKNSPSFIHASIVWKLGKLKVQPERVYLFTKGLLKKLDPNSPHAWHDYETLIQTIPILWEYDEKFCLKMLSDLAQRLSQEQYYNYFSGRLLWKLVEKQTSVRLPQYLQTSTRGYLDMSEKLRALSEK